MVFSAPAMLTVRISHFLRTVKLVDQPDPATDPRRRSARDPVTPSARPAGAVNATDAVARGAADRAVAAQTRQRATPQTTSSTPSSAHASAQVLILVAACCVTSVRNARGS